MNPGQEVVNVLDVTQLINYPVSANYSGRGSVCSQGFHRPEQKARKLHAGGSNRCSVTSRLVGPCANPLPRDLCGPAGFVVLPWTKLGLERVLRTERD